MREGEIQQNCLSDPQEVDACLCGAICLYRVLGAERATAAIARGTDGVWRLVQLRGAQNRPVEYRTRALVLDWLSAAQRSAQTSPH